MRIIIFILFALLLLPSHSKAASMIGFGSSAVCGTNPGAWFYWDCESATITTPSCNIDATGDTSATAVSVANISSVQSKTGTYSCYLPSNVKCTAAATPWSCCIGEGTGTCYPSAYKFTISDADNEVGSAELLVYVDKYLNTGRILSLWADVNNQIRLSMVDSGSPYHFKLEYEGNNTIVSVIHATQFSEDTWYKVFAKWRTTGTPNLSLGFCDATSDADCTENTPITSDTDLTAFSVDPDEIYIGNLSGTLDDTIFVDNIRLYKYWR